MVRQKGPRLRKTLPLPWQEWARRWDHATLDLSFSPPLCILNPIVTDLSFRMVGNSNCKIAVLWTACFYVRGCVSPTPWLHLAEDGKFTQPFTDNSAPQSKIIRCDAMQGRCRGRAPLRKLPADEGERRHGRFSFLHVYVEQLVDSGTRLCSVQL